MSPDSAHQNKIAEEAANQKASTPASVDEEYQCPPATDHDDIHDVDIGPFTD